VLTDGTTVEQHPSVERAAAAVREAFLALQRTELPAPVAGQVARRTVQVGQRWPRGAADVAGAAGPGVGRGQLQGSAAAPHAHRPAGDAARRPLRQQVAYRGRVAGLGAGTGAAFALLPAQNATGNWIKVVQRVPVRVEIDAKDLAAHPLRVGLSMQATVDVGAQRAQPLAAAASAPRAPAAAPRLPARQ
jgi:membrane fusion protein (multidrug efflux system)